MWGRGAYVCRDAVSKEASADPPGTPGKLGCALPSDQSLDASYFILSQSWNPELCNQGVSRVGSL